MCWLLKPQHVRLFVFDNAFVAVAMFFWLSYVPVAMISVWKTFKNRKVFVEKDLCRLFNDSFSIIFQITTRSATKTSVVKRGIQSITSSAEKVSFYNYQISVVTDDPQDRWTLNNERCEVVVVEKNYHTNAIKKGRALQYAVEHRKRIGKNTTKRWIFHMDEESYATPQTILALLKFIRKGKGVVSEGPIFYPLKFESANRLTAIAESVRPYACYDCVSQMTNPPPLHMHGSNLLVRSDIEDSIGWNFGPTLAEDQIFGYKIYEKYGPKSMGWHGGMLLEQPPLNIKDHFMQRRRWVLGSLQNMVRFPLIHKFKLMFKLVTYFMGFVSGVVSTILYFDAYIPKVLLVLSISISEFNLDIISWFDIVMKIFSSEATMNASINGGTLDPIIGLILLFPYTMWLFSYQLGLFLNLRYSKISLIKRVALHLQTLLLSVVIGLLETFPAFYAMLEYYLRGKTNRMKKIYDFYVIKK